MSELSACVYDGAFIATAIESSTVSEADIHAALSDGDATIVAVAALLVGIHNLESSKNIAALCALLDDDSLTSRSATWALGQIDSEKSVLAMLENGSIDQRENVYRVLSTLAAHARHSDNLATTMNSAVDNEMKRVARGKSGLGEKACRVLAILGDASTSDSVQRVISEDQYCDRFEIQRLRKCMDNNGRDSETIEELTQAWQQQFADDCADDCAVLPAEKAPSHTDSANDNNTVAHAQDPATASADAGATDTKQATEQATEQNPDDTPAFDPIDWEAFLASDEAASLDDQAKTITTQMGPMFEQLSVRAIGKPLYNLVAQEFATLVLQILPQAIPPEYMQAALSPPALNGMKALAQFLQSTGVVENDELQAGVQQIRETIQHQIRASGSLHSSDYDDPETEEPTA